LAGFLFLYVLSIRKFWTDIETYFIQSINFSYDRSYLQLYRSIFTKTNKDTQIRSNWRPISLLNVEYNIETKAIANQIKRL
jgi:hypothetical protein